MWTHITDVNLYLYCLQTNLSVTLDQQYHWNEDSVYLGLTLFQTIEQRDQQQALLKCWGSYSCVTTPFTSVHLPTLLYLRFTEPYCIYFVFSFTSFILMNNTVATIYWFQRFIIYHIDEAFSRNRKGSTEWEFISNRL